MAIVKKLKKAVNKGADFYSHIIVRLGRVLYSREYKSMPAQEGEKEWKKRWSVLQKKPAVNCYRKYATISDNPANIIPLDLMNTIIQPILNPNVYRPYYLDKNTFEKIYGKENLPVAVLRSIDGVILDADYNNVDRNAWNNRDIKGAEELIAKPSRDSYGGRNILLFKRDENGVFRWNEDTKKELSIHLLNELLGKNWILQKKLTQHPFMATFNESSVNTFRVHIYRSPITGKIDIAGMCMRVGEKGKWYDNIHSGGFCVAVDLENGTIGYKTSDGHGDPIKNTHGIDFEKEKFVVPNFQKLKDFALEIGSKVIHHHSLAADIMMNEEGEFKLIEVNIGTFDANMYMATGSTSFGKYTDEVIQYCKDKKNEVKFVHVIPW